MLKLMFLVLNPLGDPFKFSCLSVVAHLLSRVQGLFVIPRTAACQASLSFTISGSLLKLMSIELAVPSNY